MGADDDSSDDQEQPATFTPAMVKSTCRYHVEALTRSFMQHIPTTSSNKRKKKKKKKKTKETQDSKPAPADEVDEVDAAIREARPGLS
jgi:hypothetical protein